MIEKRIVARYGEDSELVIIPIYENVAENLDYIQLSSVLSNIEVMTVVEVQETLKALFNGNGYNIYIINSWNIQFSINSSIISERKKFILRLRQLYPDRIQTTEDIITKLRNANSPKIVEKIEFSNLHDELQVIPIVENIHSTIRSYFKIECSSIYKRSSSDFYTRTQDIINNKLHKILHKLRRNLFINAGCKIGEYDNTLPNIHENFYNFAALNIVIDSPVFDTYKEEFDEQIKFFEKNIEKDKVQSNYLSHYNHYKEEYKKLCMYIDKSQKKYNKVIK